MSFSDRRHAGRALAGVLDRYANRGDVIVLALPRGGVPVAAEVARALGAPLDLIVVRKIGVPGHEELAMGAITSTGALVRNDEVLAALQIGDDVFADVAAHERAEVARREHLLRGDRPPADVAGRTVIVVDDGVATGATMSAAIEAIAQHKPARIIIAVPVGSASALAHLRDRVDHVVCAVSPRAFSAVGAFYESFPQTTDDEVRALLAAAARSAIATPPPVRTIVELAIPHEAGACVARLSLPSAARGVVLSAHGSGRDSPRNRFVAARLFDAGFATLLADLLTHDEIARDDVNAHHRFDIALLARRVAVLVVWARTSPLADLPIGLFGASTGAAAAIVAAARHADAVRAIVSRGGRLDLAGAALAEVRAPTLLVVGARDEAVLRLNQRAFEVLRSEKALRVVPNATHLFEQSGRLDQVARHARDWFDRHLVASQERPAARAP